MPKVLIKQTFAGDITIIDGAPRLTGVTIVDHWEVTDEDGDTNSKLIPRAATLEELGLLLGGEVANYATALATLNAQYESLHALQDATLQERDAARTQLARAAGILAEVNRLTKEPEQPQS